MLGSRRSKRVIFIGSVLAASLVSAGCGSSTTDRMVVSGNVSYAGQPVQNGMIRFVPAGDTKGAVATALITDGKYQADANGGVVAGTHRVEITGMQPSKQPSRLGVPSFEKGAGKQYIPEQYNSSSTLAVTIEETPFVSKDFELK